MSRLKQGIQLAMKPVVRRKVAPTAPPERPSDVAYSVSAIDMDGNILCDFEMTRATLEVFQRAAAQGIHGVGLGGVLSGVLYEAARRFEPPPFVGGAIGATRTRSSR